MADTTKSPADKPTGKSTPPDQPDQQPDQPNQPDQPDKPDQQSTEVGKPASTDDDDTRSPEEQHDDRMATLRAQQGLNEGQVPEQRPQAFLRNEGSKSELSKRIEESLPDQGPMDHSAYERASSDAQIDKAAESELQEGLMVGAAVEVVDEDSPHVGRVFAIVNVLGRNVKDTILNASGSPEQRMQQPSEMEGRAVGGEREGELVVLSAEQVKKIPEGQIWRRVGGPTLV